MRNSKRIKIILRIGIASSLLTVIFSAVIIGLLTQIKGRVSS